MRANTAFTKMLTAMLKRNAYHRFLIDTLLKPIQSVINEPDLNLDINPVNVYQEMIEKKKRDSIEYDCPESVSEEVASKNEEVIAMMKPRYEKLDHYCRTFLTTIFESYKSSPYSVRFMCKKIFQYGTDRYDDATRRDIYSLVGGLIFLRFFNPAITTCDTASVNIINKS